MPAAGAAGHTWTGENDRCVALGTAAGIDCLVAPKRRHVSCVEDIFNGDRQAVKLPARRGSVAAPRLFQGGVRIEEFPRPDVRFARLNARKTCPHQRFRRQAARRDLRRGFTCGEFVGLVDRLSPIGRGWRSIVEFRPLFDNPLRFSE